MAFDLSTAKPVAQPAPASGGFDLSTAKPAVKGRDWSDVPMEALGNVLPSAGRFAEGIYDAVRHPIDTGTNLLKAVSGGVQNAAPESLRKLAAKLDTNPQGSAEARRVADDVGGFFKDRYGSIEGLKNTLATDPVGAAADASTIFSGGATLAGRAGMAGTAAALRAGSRVTNPLALAGTAASKAAPVVGNALANIVGGLGTHTGAESLKGAYNAGRAGGQAATDLADNMRGNVPITDVLEKARANVQEMGRLKSAEYDSGMASVRTDPTVLSFNGIDKAVQDAAKDVRFKSQIKNEKGAAVQQKIADEIEAWKTLPANEYHTPAGLDALKQKIGDIVDAIPFEEKAARRVGDNMYHAVKAEIVKQAPSYADTMKQYSEATETIREIERSLSLGKKASADTAMRKLQSLTRNNASTNYGYRLNLARQLEEQGGNSLMPALSGQALSAWTPRGLGTAGAGASSVGAFLAGGPLAAAGALAVQSPRVMGETALAAGKGARVLSNGAAVPLNGLARLGLDGPDLANYLYQADRLNQQK